jgi:VCBS repeat-containing protein
MRTIRFDGGVLHRAGTPHNGQLEISGLPAGEYVVTSDGTAMLKVADSKTSQVVALQVNGATSDVVIEKNSSALAAD